MADCLHEASALKIRLTTFLSILALFLSELRPGQTGAGEILGGPGDPGDPGDLGDPGDPEDPGGVRDVSEVSQSGR